MWLGVAERISLESPQQKPLQHQLYDVIYLQCSTNKIMHVCVYVQAELHILIFQSDKPCELYMVLPRTVVNEYSFIEK